MLNVAEWISGGDLVLVLPAQLGEEVASGGAVGAAQRRSAISRLWRVRRLLRAGKTSQAAIYDF